MGSTTHHRARVYAVHPQNPQPRELDQLVEILRTDGVIIYPTDTLYGLGCSIESPKAIARIARIKGLKPREARFSFICERLGQVAEYARMSDATYSVLRHNLPGPFTMILPGLSKCGESFMSPRKTVGIGTFVGLSDPHQLAAARCRRAGVRAVPRAYGRALGHAGGCRY